jgi:uncharacterized protein
MILAAIELTGNYKLAVAIIVGMFVGFILVKSDTTWRSTCIKALRLKDGRILKTLLFALGFGVLFFHLGTNWQIITPHVRESFLWPSILGGLFCGTGLAICGKIPLTATASLAAGRIHALWVIIGMVLAYPVIHVVSGFFSETIYSWGSSLPYHNDFSEFFAIDNFALWITGLMMVMACIIHFALCRSEGESS